MREKTRKKILFLITKSSWGGAQQYVFDLATHLDSSTFDVTVALGGEGRLVSELERAGVRTVRIGSLQRDISLIREVVSTFELVALIQRERPDILHINSSKAGGLGAFLGRVLFVPKVIFTAHAWAFNEDRPWWQRVVIMFLHWVTVMLAHQTIAVSEMTKMQMVLPFARRKMVVVHNGRNVSSFENREEARASLAERVPGLQPFRNDFWSVTVAELHRVKQHDVTVRAMKQIVQKHPDVRHIIIGEGEERRALESLITTEGLAGNVFLAGHVPDASRYLPAFNLFILPSRSEALAYVLIEACVAGLPILASEVGGIPEILTPGAGILSPSGDIPALAQHYVRLYEHPEECALLAQGARERAPEFSLEKMLEKTLTVYRS